MKKSRTENETEALHTRHVENLKSIPKLMATAAAGKLTIHRREELTLTINKIVQDSDVDDVPLFEQIETISICMIIDPLCKSYSFAIGILLQCCSYFERIGFRKKSLALALKTLEYAEERNDIGLRRRAHNTVAVAHVRLANFTDALLNLQKAYTLAHDARDELGKLAVLANTVAALETMGLLRDACNLALKVSLQNPRGEFKADHIHLSNASNGLRLSYQLNDTAAARKFFAIANADLAGGSVIGEEITRAHYDAACIVHLASEGNLESARKLSDHALKNALAGRNIRITSLIVCAQAEINLISGETEKIEQSKVLAEELISATKQFPELHEEILRVLVKLFVFEAPSTTAVLPKRAEEFLRLLRSHILTVKHHIFFENISCRIKESQEFSAFLENPSYNIPFWIENLWSTNFEQGQDKENPKRKNTPHDIIQLARYRECSTVCSARFIVAENWAVAAELGGGGSGYHCFQVGMVAAAIARELGFPAEQVHRIELACRLHDIGEIALTFSQSDVRKLRAMGKFSLLCEHTIVGERLLASAEDETLLLAACIAKSHHEWWNGCGYPVGLKGTAIPMEARICAIADIFASLVWPVRHEEVWPVKMAIQQMETMSGMQLDPNLLLPLSKIAHSCTGILNNVEALFENNELVNTRRKLYETIELVG